RLIGDAVTVHLVNQEIRNPISRGAHRRDACVPSAVAIVAPRCWRLQEEDAEILVADAGLERMIAPDLGYIVENLVNVLELDRGIVAMGTEGLNTADAHGGEGTLLLES